MKRIIRLTESDLTRIVSRVINEQNESQETYNYCDIGITADIKRQYFNIQSYVDKLKELENIPYECESHKYLVRNMVLKNMYDYIGGEYIPYFKLPEGTKMYDLENFLKTKYDILK